MSVLNRANFIYMNAFGTFIILLKKYSFPFVSFIESSLPKII